MDILDDVGTASRVEWTMRNFAITRCEIPFIRACLDQEHGQRILASRTAYVRQQWTVYLVIAIILGIGLLYGFLEPSGLFRNQPPMNAFALVMAWIACVMIFGVVIGLGIQMFRARKSPYYRFNRWFRDILPAFPFVFGLSRHTDAANEPIELSPFQQSLIDDFYAQLDTSPQH